MNLIQSKKFDKEYCARIVHITSFEPHPNPKCTRMKCALVGAFSISVSIDTKPGYFVYFPVGSQIDGSYLAANNLFRKAQMNHDSTKTGFFEDTRKVKPIKLQGFPSEGFLMPVVSIKTWFEVNNWEIGVLPSLVNNTDFDSVDDHQLVKRYFVRHQHVQGVPKVKGKDPSSKLSKLVEGQFHLHYDTDSLERMPWVIKPWNLIHISTKMHGTSGISANVLCKPPKSKWVSTAIWLANHTIYALANLFSKDTKYGAFHGNVYDILYSSRKVIKNEYYNENQNNGYYGNDAFRAIANDVLKPHLDKGITVYYELVGYTTTGTPIQSVGGNPCDYGCVPPDGSYEYGKNFDIRIYRITYTNPDGMVHEFSAHEVQIWCKQHDLHAVKELYWGFAKDLYPDLDIHAEDWATQFCRRIKNDQGRFFMELDSPDCINSVPHEGIVIRIDDGKQAAYKVKAQRFLHKEDADYDKGIVNIEDAELTEEDT